MKIFRDNEKLWKELKGFKNNIITEIKQNEMVELKNTVESLANRMNAAEERISDRWQQKWKHTVIKYLEENLNKTKKSIWEMSDIIKKSCIKIIGILEVLKKRIAGAVLENCKKELPKLWEHKGKTNKEEQRTPNRLNPERSSSRHIFIMLPSNENKERILKQLQKNTKYYLEENQSETLLTSKKRIFK